MNNVNDQRSGRPLPVTVILPCKDNEKELEAHLSGMRAWIDVVDHIVVVDSSTDDSLVILKNQLPADRTEFHHLPQGLYQAWNFGAAKVRSRYCYYATVGDSISLEDLTNLVDVAEDTSSHVVVAPPRMIKAEGTSGESERWPGHSMAEALRAHGVNHAVIPEALLGLLSCALAPKSLLGSSASNLYRADFLQTHPWPVDFGHGGDTAWLCRHYAEIRFTICAQEAGQFVHHYQHEIKDARDDAALAARMRTECFAKAGQLQPRDRLDLNSLLSLGGMKALDSNQKVLWDWVAGHWETSRTVEQQHNCIVEQSKYIQVLEAENQKLKRSFLNRMVRTLLGNADRSGRKEAEI